MATTTELTAAQQAKLARIANRSTLYEVALARADKAVMTFAGRRHRRQQKEAV